MDVNPTDKQVEMWLRAKADIGQVSDGEALILSTARTTSQAPTSGSVLILHD